MKAKFRVEQCSQLESQSLFSVVAKQAVYLLSGFNQQRQEVGHLGQGVSEMLPLLPTLMGRMHKDPISIWGQDGVN